MAFGGPCRSIAIGISDCGEDFPWIMIRKSHRRIGVAGHSCGPAQVEVRKKIQEDSRRVKKSQEENQESPREAQEYTFS
jgi:hypothetical protein